MNELDRYARSWGATAVPFGPLSETQWISIPSQQRALSLLDQTAALRGVMLLSGGNGMGKSTLVGRCSPRSTFGLNSAVYNSPVLFGFRLLRKIL